jgi:hypothetical protein
MTLLAEAIRQSDAQSASWTAPNGTAVLVERVTGREGSFDQEEYAVRTQRPGEPPVARAATNDLPEALERMAALGIPGFDPGGTGWEAVMV